ncbi:MAG: hypothetical protein ACHQ53_01110 [Polyangiales bacterium]
MHAALLPLLLLAVTPAPGLALCAQGDALHHSCCCPAHAAHRAPQAELSTSCCCKLEQQRVPVQSSSVLRVERGSGQSVAPAAHDPTDVESPLRSAVSAAPEVPRARGGPPLFILHRSLLI